MNLIVRFLFTATKVALETGRWRDLICCNCRCRELQRQLVLHNFNNVERVTNSYEFVEIYDFRTPILSSFPRLPQHCWNCVAVKMLPFQQHVSLVCSDKSEQTHASCISLTVEVQEEKKGIRGVDTLRVVGIADDPVSLTRATFSATLRKPLLRD